MVTAKAGYTQTLDKLRTYYRAFTVNPGGKDTVWLLRNAPTMANNPNGANVIDINPNDPDHVLMTLWNTKILNQDNVFSRLHKANDDGFKYDVFQTDVRTGKGAIFKTGEFNTTRWLSDGYGSIVAQIFTTENPPFDHVTVQQNGTWKEIGSYRAEGDEDSGVVGLSKDGHSLIQSAYNEQSMNGLIALDMNSGKTSPLYFDPAYDISQVIKDEWNGRVIGTRYISDQLQSRYFDPADQALQTGLEAAFPGLQVSIVSSDMSKTNVIVGVGSPRKPTEYYSLNRNTHQASLLALTYPTLKENDLGEVKAYPYKARDGLNISAYLTLPPGKTAKNMPIVVMPHGGPDARDYIRFDWMAQFLANRGYVVLQPNFRGSRGYGHKFTEAGLQQWGLKMQDDITDGVKKLIADGIADPKRVCIVGGSYGGYAALAGATFTPDLYACAVAIAPVSDLAVQLAAEIKDGGGHTRLASFWFSRMGDDSYTLAKVSPSRHADKVTAPILLLHGKNDTTVLLEQSKIEAEALKAAGKQVEFITFEGEDHYLELGATRVAMLKEMERFLKQHIGN